MIPDYTSEYGYSYSEPYGADELDYYGAEGDPAGGGAAGETFFAKAWNTIRDYAGRVSGNMLISLGVGAAVGLGSAFIGNSDWIEAAAYGLVAAGAFHLAATLIAGGFSTLSSMTPWYGAGLMLVGFVFPVATDFVMEKTGLGFAL